MFITNFWDSTINFNKPISDEILDCFIEETNDNKNYSNISDEQREFVKNCDDLELKTILEIGDKCQNGYTEEVFQHFDKNGLSKMISTLVHREVQEKSKQKGFQPKKKDVKAYIKNSDVIHNPSLILLKKK
jgi:hypothetical protein